MCTLVTLLLLIFFILQNALNLTAPASSVLLNNRRNSWVQLSGHPGCLAPAGPGTIWKKRSGETNESTAYQDLMKDVAKDIVPTYYKEVMYEGECILFGFLFNLIFQVLQINYIIKALLFKNS